MFAPFIPPSAQRLQDGDAIALLQRIYRQPVMVPGLNGDEPIPTARHMNESSTPFLDGLSLNQRDPQFIESTLMPI